MFICYIFVQYLHLFNDLNSLADKQGRDVVNQRMNECLHFKMKMSSRVDDLPPPQLLQLLSEVGYEGAGT